mgnify:CR=1 FL=1
MLQETRGMAPLHIYMQGDSAFRQQKNFLCNLLQPGFTGDVWALGKQHGQVCRHAASWIRLAPFP